MWWLTLFALPSLAATPASPLEIRDALQAEVDRTEELSLAGHGAPHHVLARGAFGWELDVSAEHGAVVSSNMRSLDDLDFEVRVGDPSFDNMGLQNGRRNSGVGAAGIAEVPTARYTREHAWRRLDGLYKASVENLGRRQAVRATLEEGGPLPPDWQVLDTPTVLEEVADPPEAPALGDVEAYARAVTAGTRGAPLLQSNVRVLMSAGHGLLVASDGTSIVSPAQSVWVRVRLEARADDGETRTVTRSWYTSDVSVMPDLKEVSSTATEMAERLTTWASAPPLEEPWVGPVLLEGVGAAWLMQDTLVRAVQGTPKAAEFRAWDQTARPAQQRYQAPGTQLLPKGWTAFDDGTAADGDPCCPSVDSEGSPLTAVSLVEDGVLVRHLMTRTPSEHFEGTTGHAVRQSGRRCEARPTWLHVEPPRHVPQRVLRRKARSAARAAGVDRVLVLRDWGLGLGTWLMLDGTEVPVRAFGSSELDARALRGMTVAGPARTVRRSTWRTMFTVPDLLLTNVAITPKEPRTRMPEPRRPSPLWTANGD